MRWPYKKSPPITYEMLQLWPANSCCCFFSWAETLFSTRYRNLDTAFELQRRSGSISNLGAPICSRPHWSHIPCPCDSSFQIPDSKPMKCSILCEIFRHLFRAESVNNFPEIPTTAISAISGA